MEKLPSDWGRILKDALKRRYAKPMDEHLSWNEIPENYFVVVCFKGSLYLIHTKRGMNKCRRRIGHNKANWYLIRKDRIKGNTLIS
jgi:hypothetical protein